VTSVFVRILEEIELGELSLCPEAQQEMRSFMEPFEWAKLMHSEGGSEHGCAPFAEFRGVLGKCFPGFLIRPGIQNYIHFPPYTLRI